MRRIIYIIYFIFIGMFLIDYYIHVKNNNTIETIDESKVVIKITKDSIDRRIDESWKNDGK